MTNERRRGSGILMPLIILILWTAITLSAMFRIVQNGSPTLAMFAVVCIGGYGIYSLGKNIVAKIRRDASEP